MKLTPEREECEKILFDIDYLFVEQSIVWNWAPQMLLIYYELLGLY